MNKRKTDCGYSRMKGMMIKINSKDIIIVFIIDDKAGFVNS